MVCGPPPGVAEVALPEAGWRIAERPLAIGAGDSLPEELGIDIGGQDRDVPVREIGQQLMDQNRQRIGLFSGAACRAPDAQSLLAAPPLADQVGEHATREDIEQGAVPEKIGLTNRQVAGQYLDLRLPVCPPIV